MVSVSPLPPAGPITDEAQDRNAGLRPGHGTQDRAHAAPPRARVFTPVPGPLRIGIVGAGYIATWHAAAIRAVSDARLTAVCDTSQGAAQALAQAHGARVFATLADMAAARVCDAVYILSPPDSHAPLALEAIAHGLHVLVEKPVALDADETLRIAQAAAAQGVQFAAGHNFLGTPAYARLRAMHGAGLLGRVATAEVHWCLPLAPLRSGPFGLWLLRQPHNLILELGAHPVSMAVDLFGPLEIRALDLGHPVELSGGGQRHQTWRILARAANAARTEVTIVLSTVETLDDRSLTLRGSSGLVRLDYANDVLTLRRDNTADLVLNPLLAELSHAWSHLREGTVNAVRQLASLNAKSPYGLSFRGLTREFVAAVTQGRRLDGRFDGTAAVNVMQALGDVVALMPPEPAMPAQPELPAPHVRNRTPRPTAVVIGGTGFIGRNLTRALVAKGQDVRVLSRGGTGPFGDIADHVETVPVSLRDTDGLIAAMRGIGTVFNLAKSVDTTWASAVENDVGVAVRVAEAALAAKVGRLVYTGTIASYDMSDRFGTITEATPFGNIDARNIYARSKAECEARLLALHAGQGLPLTIARPGIVVGHGGPLQHWGIGRWHGAGAVRLWGNGRGILPFVLADDVSDGLIRMAAAPAALGQSYNLIGDPMLTARDYFDAIHHRLGARLRVTSGNLTAMWLADGVKWGLKRYALGQREALRASRADWLSRGHLSKFANDRPKADLGWQPEPAREAFLRRAIDEAGLFGF